METQTEMVEKARARMIESETGCWLWTGAKDVKGYGKIGRKKNGKTRVIPVHRLMLAESTGRLLQDVPTFELALHSCNTPSCCNPKHLRWGSKSDNAFDAVADGVHPSTSKRSCPKGHPLVAPNLIEWNARRGTRKCALCHRAHNKITYARKRGNDLAWEDAIASVIKKRQELREFAS